MVFVDHSEAAVVLAERPQATPHRVALEERRSTNAPTFEAGSRH
jgi:hypothetical protein